jgi:hypothetical protein
MTAKSMKLKRFSRSLFLLIHSESTKIAERVDEEMGILGDTLWAPGTGTNVGQDGSSGMANDNAALLTSTEEHKERYDEDVLSVLESQMVKELDQTQPEKSASPSTEMIICG